MKPKPDPTVTYRPRTNAGTLLVQGVDITPWVKQGSVRIEWPSSFEPGWAEVTVTLVAGKVEVE